MLFSRLCRLACGSGGRAAFPARRHLMPYLVFERHWKSVATVHWLHIMRSRIKPKTKNRLSNCQALSSMEDKYASTWWDRVFQWLVAHNGPGGPWPIATLCESLASSRLLLPAYGLLIGKRLFLCWQLGLGCN
jgi:hypothetical protein